MTSLLGNLGRLAVYRGDYERAAALIQETIAIARELGSRVSIADWWSSRHIGVVPGELQRSGEVPGRNAGAVS